jgi:preprotein translocase subunit Sec63
MFGYIIILTILSLYAKIWWISVQSRTKAGLSVTTSHQLFRAITFTHDIDIHEIIKIISRCSEITMIIDTYRTNRTIRELVGKYLKLSKRDISLVDSKIDSVSVSLPENGILIVVRYGC